MKFSSTLLFAAAASALDVLTDGSKPFGIMSLRSASRIHLASVVLSGDALTVGSGSTLFTIKDGVLYADDKAIDFSSGEAKVASDGKGTSGVSLEKGYVSVPGFNWGGCPEDNGTKYIVENDSQCESDGIPFGAYAVAGPESTESAAASSAAASSAVETSAVETAAAETSAPSAAPSGNSGAVVTQIGDGQVQAPPSAPPAAPEQANGAVSVGVSAAALGVAAAALLI